MRIAFVSEHASPLAALGGVDAGGQNVHVAALADALQGHGHDVVVFTRRDDAMLPTRVPFRSGAVVHHVDAGPAATVPKDDLLPFMGRFAGELRAVWEGERPDVVHAHFWMSGMAALAAATPLGIPVAQTFHALGTVKRRYQGAADTSPPERIDVERTIARDARALVATCRDERRELLAMGADLHRITVVPCGVDLDAFGPDGAVWDGPGWTPSAGLRVLSLGRLVERKGIADLLVALAGVPLAELVVAGGPPRERLDADPEYQRQRRIADRVGVSDRVHWIGRVARPDVPALIRAADVVACTPWYEPFGMVPLEAMACGRPVLGTAVGGLLDTVTPGETGLLVPPKQPSVLRSALTELMQHPARRAAMGRAGLARVRSEFGWDRVAVRTLEVYGGVCAARRRAMGARP